MLKSKKNIVKAFFVVAVIFTLWPTTMVAAPPVPVQPINIATELLPQQKSDPLFMFSSYQWSDTRGPSLCPDPPIFKNGTRTVYSYMPGFLNKDVEAAVLWYELDKKGNPIGDPIGTVKGNLSADSMPFTWLSFNRGASGLIGVYMFMRDARTDWEIVGYGLYGLARRGKTVPEPGNCVLP